MKDAAIFLTFAVCFCAAIAGCAYLVMHDHPWFGFFVLCMGGGLSIKRGKAES